ncbi:hypothetical protein Scani_33320 [Streptomyces caniferus]|uniref:Uncharacterized protein n=1 Tax=Streptomyces caniferus TaxID=285557 RepID=A0A640S8E6_9ACTN|nr:hypothetical protein Scani_33320 [Streptomyces caniferus]
MVAGGHQGAVDDEDGVPVEPALLPECRQRTDVVNDAVRGRLEIPNSGASWRMVKFVRQYAVTSRTRNSSDRLQGRRAVDLRLAPVVLRLPICRSSAGSAP